MGKLYEDFDGDCMYVSDAGVWYELQDTVSTRSRKKVDMMHMMVSYVSLEDYDEYDDLYSVLDEYGIDVDTESYVGYFWGSSYLLDAIDGVYFDNAAIRDSMDIMESISSKFERNHPNVVDLFSKVPVPSSWNQIV